MALVERVEEVARAARAVREPFEAEPCPIGLPAGALEEAHVALQVEDQDGAVGPGQDLSQERSQADGGLVGPGAAHDVGVARQEVAVQEDGVVAVETPSQIEVGAFVLIE